MNKLGFTLIELMIVIIIIGVLAAIAAPMMSSNVVRARRSEAVAIMGAIRTAERLYFVDSNAYTNVLAGAWTATGNLNRYIQGADFNGRWFNSAAFSVTDASATDYNIVCDPALLSAAARREVNVPDGPLYMNSNGNITNY